MAKAVTILTAFLLFTTAVKAKYPGMIIIVSTTGMTFPKNAGQDYYVYNRQNLNANEFNYFRPLLEGP